MTMMSSCTLLFPVYFASSCTLLFPVYFASYNYTVSCLLFPGIFPVPVCMFPVVCI